MLLIDSSATPGSMLGDENRRSGAARTAQVTTKSVSAIRATTHCATKPPTGVGRPFASRAILDCDLAGNYR